MKPTTVVSAKFESIGKPAATVTITDETVTRTAIELARWLTTVYMGSHIRVTIARSPAELKLHTSRSHAGDTNAVSLDLMSEIESILAQPALPLAPDPEA